jgi:hypothetical protein
MSRKSYLSWLVETTSFEARQYAVVSILQLVCLSCVQMHYISSTLFSDALNLSFSLRAMDHLYTHMKQHLKLQLCVF